MKSWFCNIISDPLFSFVTDSIGFCGGILSIETSKKIKRRIFKNKKVVAYNENRENIKSELGAIQQILSENLEVKDILFQNKLKKVLSKMEYYQDVISDNKLKRYIKNIRKNKDMIENLEKLKLICDREEMIL